MPSGQLPAEDRSPLIVALGDSTTAGTPGFRSPIEAPPDGAGDPESQYAYWLMQWRPWRVENRGVNGERTEQIARRFARDVADRAPALVIVVAGVNDIYDGDAAADVIDRLAALYARAAAAGIRVLAGSILPFDTATAAHNRAMHEVNAWIRARPRSDRNLAFVDTRRAVAHPDHPDRLYASPDGLHPSVEGYRRMAAALLPAVEACLGSRLPR